MSNLSFVLALITAFLWGLAPVLEKMGLKGSLNPLAGVVIRSLAVSVVAFLSLLFLKRLPELLHGNFRDLAFIIVGGLMAGFFAQWSFYGALKYGQASKVIPVVVIYPLVTLFFSVLFLHEALTWQKIVGILLVIFGVMLVK